MWPLPMQHHAAAINANRQLDGSDFPWQLKCGEDFPAMHIPFGAKVLFWNNPKTTDNTAGKLSATANEGLFIGYHIQPGHDWKGEYLVAKLEAADYHVNWDSTGGIHNPKNEKVGIAIWRFHLSFESSD